ncbi:multiple monosaccharide ABC transporter substrate-binding protein [Oerskovia flava]|uniref:multiple monosaccharide ABC transporter substrate-binding protein n=1 Tax=Oerskovia flava TaxID=2986422 RepID=UPI002240608A|nr:multiple monosaccharide ABC transporter substrate-binding protein [Oerskovia sp. JB1-3-2]
MRRFTIAATGAVLALGLAACAGGGAGSDGSTAEESGEGGLIGVAMPTETSERWIADGNAVKAGLEEAGYDVDLQYAADDIPTQQQQIDQMITKGADLLIVASIDGTALSNQLQAAADQGIPVIAYDRLIRDSENVDFYVTFDNYAVGHQQATSLLAGLGVLTEDGSDGDATGPFNIELFAGSLDDNNAHFFWQGAIDRLEPYIEDGTISVPSGQTEIEQAATLRWSQETAQKRMEDLLTSTYSDGTELHGVLSPYDGISRGIITALQNDGSGPTIPEGLPVVTGQDAEIGSVKLIDEDVQYATIFKDTRKLADQAVIVAQAFLSGEEPEANDTESYDNGVKVVPSFLLVSDVVYKSNYYDLLLETGYWTEAQVASGQS